MWAHVVIFHVCNCFVHSINSASPRSHAVRPEKDNLYGSYPIDQVHGQPSGSASPPELFRQGGSWAGGGSRADVACDTGKFCLTHVPFSKLCWCWFIHFCSLALLPARGSSVHGNILHVSFISLVLSYALSLLFCSLTLRRLMSYIYGAPILDVSRSHTTTQHSR